MRAAIYARKSTEQNVADDAKSVTRQTDLARAFITAKGWTVDDRHVFIDDAVSGAEFVDRHGLNNLMAAMRQAPRPYDAIVTMGLDRIGREQFAVAKTLLDIVEAGVRVFYYTDGSELKLDTPIAKITMSLQGFAAEDYRHQIRVKTREALRSKAAKGHVAGGICYGYTNQRTAAGHVERVIDPAEADVVRRIFQLAADGYGLLRTVKVLNDENIPSPKHRGHRRGWSVTGVRDMLHRPLYRGEVIYGRTRWTDKGGTKVKVDVPEPEWLRLEAPHFRIVSPELWDAAHERMTKTRKLFFQNVKGKFNGRMAAGLASRFLLSGFLRCGTCGGSVVAFKRTAVRGRPGHYYACNTHRTRGDRVCANRWQADLQPLTAAILAELKKTITHSDQFIPMLAEQVKTLGADRERLTEARIGVDDAIAKTEDKLARLAEAVAEGAPLRTLREAIERGERERADLLARREHLEGQLLASDLAPDAWETWGRLFTLAANDFGALLAGDIPGARRLLATLLDGPITLHADPEDDGTVVFSFTATGKFDGALRLIWATWSATRDRQHDDADVVRERWCPRPELNRRPTV